jgi:hypothetical protein
MLPAGYKPAIHALDRVAIGIDSGVCNLTEFTFDKVKC